MHSAKMPYGSSASRCRMGSAKAAVLPQPVGALAITSRPASAAGTQCRCTGVGTRMPMAAHDSTSQGERPMAAKVAAGAGAAGAGTARFFTAG